MTSKGGIRWIEWPRVRIRSEIYTDSGGKVSKFVIQLEYNVNAQYDGRGEDDWRQVARFDHQPDHDRGHDIQEERLHMDIYRDGEKAEIKRGFPPVTVNEAPALCEQTLQQNADELVERFERWHGIRHRQSRR